MSNVGQGLTAVIGSFIGFLIGGPVGAAYGFQAGLAVGSLLFPTQLPGIVGPRLEDLETVHAQVGAPVPIVFGTFAVPGTPMWLGPVVEHEHTEQVGGKGSPEQTVTTYTYTQSIAIGLCEGPIKGITRIWENGKLVYDVRPQSEVEDVFPSDRPALEAFQSRLEAAQSYEDSFTLYLGDEEQNPDPTIEAVEGTGNVPAFRGLAYIVFHDRELRDDQGRRHPQFRVEVTTLQSGEPEVRFTESGTWSKPENLESAEVIVIGAGGGGASGDAVRGGGNPHSGGAGGGGAISKGTFDADDLPDSVEVIVGKGGLGGASPSIDTGSSANGSKGQHGGDSSFSDFVTAGGGRRGGGESAGVRIDGGLGGTGTTENGGRGGDGAVSNLPGGGEAATAGEDTDEAGAGGGGGQPLNNFGAVGGSAAGGSSASAVGGAPGIGQISSSGAVGSAGSAGGDSDADRGAAGGGGGGCAGGHIGGGGSARGGDGGPGGYPGGGGGGGGAAQSGDDPGDRATGGAGGRGADGLVIIKQTFGEISLTLADIITAVCDRVGLTVDASDHASRVIHGFGILRQTNARAVLESLRPLGPFDMIRSGAKLRFPKRGKPIVATLTVDDLGAHVAGATQRPPLALTRKKLDIELPRRVRLKYIAPSRDYEPGEQLSPTRLTTEAVNEIETQVPVAITDELAAQTAEILWADTWRSRWIHPISLDQRFANLQPADCIAVPIDGRLQRVRILSFNDIAGGLIRQAETCRDDDGDYTSIAVASPPQRQPNLMRFIAGTELILLDLPPLREEDDDAGIYAACLRSGIGTVWNGALIYRSIDSGATFSPVLATTSEATVGTLVQPLEDGITTTWDEAAELIVDLESGSLESRTEEAVLNGANTAAIGSDGRWQLIQFRDAEEISEGRWRLTGILRGRRATEHVTGDSIIGDRFVLVSGPGIVRLPLQTSEIGSQRVYKAVSIGATYSTGIDQTFTGNGEALEPFSPVHIRGARDESNNLTISWLRRDRFGEAWISGTDVPLSEQSESYEVDIVDGTNVLRTLATTTQSVTYTAAQQSEDGLTPGDPVEVRVYQLSAIVGRGTPGEATL